MGRSAKISEGMITLATQIVKEGNTARELRTGLCILIPKLCDVTYAKTAEVLGVDVSTVVRMHKNVRDQVEGKEEIKGSWGGRRRQCLLPEEEAEFLEPWLEAAEKGSILVVPPIHTALEKVLGRRVSASTVYRILARHGWRKIVPDTCHPKRDVEAQIEFKKNSQRQWKKL